MQRTYSPFLNVFANFYFYLISAKVSTLQGFLDQNAQQLSLAERKVNDHNLELAQVRLVVT